MSTANTQPMARAAQRAGSGETFALVGARLAQAFGWRAGAGLLGLLACPALAIGIYARELLFASERCVEITQAGRAGSYLMCSHIATDQLIIRCVALFGILCALSAVGLWRRGGAVRDVELLAERVEGE